MFENSKDEKPLICDCGVNLARIESLPLEMRLGQLMITCPVCGLRRIARISKKGLIVGVKQ